MKPIICAWCYPGNAHPLARNTRKISHTICAWHKRLLTAQTVIALKEHNGTSTKRLGAA